MCSGYCLEFSSCADKCIFYCKGGCVINCGSGCSINNCGGGCSGSGSSGACGGGCSGACSSGTSGSASCSGRCSSGSGSSLCSSGCNTGCKTSTCGGNCSATCTGDSCSTGCRSTCTGQCVNTCSGAACKTECSGTCGNGANCSNVSCGASCEEATCANTCMTECIDIACKFGCGSTCSGTCEDTCYSECSSGACKNKCSDSCLGSCKNDGCAWTCSVGCSNTCYDACGTSCVNNCNDTCVSTCKFGCETSCKGMTTKTSTFKDKVFDENAKEEPPHTLGEKFDRDGAFGDYGPGVAGKDGYDPNFPNTPYDNDFATTPNALNDETFVSENRERKYNGEFAADGTVVKTPKAFEFGKESIIESGDYVKVPQDAVYDGNVTYYTRSGDGSAGNPYVFSKRVFANASEFDNIVHNTTDIGRVYNVWMKRREFIERKMITSGGNSSMTSELKRPVDNGKVRKQDTYHANNGALVVTMDNKSLIQVGTSESFIESSEYYIKGTDGKFTRAPVRVSGTNGTWDGFVTYRNARTLYKAGATVTLTSPDNSSTTYDK